MIKRKTIEKLEFQNLSFQLNSEISIFEKINFEFPLGKIVWIKSEPGAGKSSLLRIIDGLSFSDSGHYKINGQAVDDMSFEEFNHYKLNMGYSFDFGGLINNRTLFQNLSLPLEYHNIYSEKERAEKVNSILQSFGISDVADKRPSSVPGSIRKAMCVARAFVHEPQLVLLDDPTTGLRVEVKKALKKMIINHHKNVLNSSIYIATEDDSFIKSLAEASVELSKSALRVETFKEKAA